MKSSRRIIVHIVYNLLDTIDSLEYIILSMFRTFTFFPYIDVCGMRQSLWIKNYIIQ